MRQDPSHQGIASSSLPFLILAFARIPRLNIMSSAPEETFFRRGRINAQDLARQRPDFVLDYATVCSFPVMHE